MKPNPEEVGETPPPKTETPKVSEMLSETLPDPENTSLPSLPGTNRTKEEKTLEEAPIPTKQEPEPPQEQDLTPQKKEKKSKGFSIPILPIAIGTVLLILVALLLLPKTEQNIEQKAPEQIENNEASLKTEIQNLQIRQQQLENQLITMTNKVETAENNIKTFQLALTTIQTSLSDVQKKSSENRNYISTIYRQALNLELRIEAVGGGYQGSSQKEPDERVVNPYIGSGELP